MIVAKRPSACKSFLVLAFLLGCLTPASAQQNVYNTYKAALAATKSKDHEKAIELYSRVLGSNEEVFFASARINRAQAYKNIGKYEEAFEDHTVYSKLKGESENRPLPKQFYLSRADVLVELGRLSEARADIEFSLGLVDEHDRFFATATKVMYAVLYKKIGDRQKAIMFADEAVGALRDKENPQKKLFGFMGLLVRSSIHVDGGNYDAALKDIANAEAFTTALFQTVSDNTSKNAVAKHMFTFIVAMYEAWVLDFAGQNQSAIDSLQDVKEVASYLRKLSPNPEQVDELTDTVDHAIAELKDIDDDRKSSVLSVLIEKYGKSFAPTIAFTETVTRKQ
jgi:tetratricopeptide (TPR) repeat protein